MASMRDSDAPILATVAYLDARGAATAPENTPAWASSDTSVASVAAGPAGDGLSAVVTAVGPGTATITATTTNSDGSSVVASADLAVTAGQPVTGTITFGGPA